MPHLPTRWTRYHLLGAGFSLLLLGTPTDVFAHAGHGDEFHQGQAAPPADAIAVDPVTAARIGLTVEPVRRQPLAFGLHNTGQIDAVPNRRVAVTNPVGGRVIKLWVEPGDRVVAGQPLAVITSGELAALRVTALENSAERRGEVQVAQANLRLAQQHYARQQQIAQRTIAHAETELRVAQEQYDRDQELMTQGALPRRVFLESEARLASAQQSVTEAKSQLAVLAAKTELERAQTELQVARSRTALSTDTYQTRLRQLGAAANADGTITITAPIAGRIADRAVSLGEAAEDAGAVLMTIVDDRTVLATANIHEKDLAQVAPGQSVRVTVASLPDRIFTGQIKTIGAVVAGDSRVVPVQAEIANPDGALKPGMFATIEVLTERTPTPVLVIPKTAIVEVNGQPLVFVQNGKTFQAVEVSLGQTAGDLVEVENGLFEGDLVVTQRAHQLYAQSLRGNRESDTHASPTTTAVETTGGAARTWHWWGVMAGSGALAIGTFVAGSLWSTRRYRQQVATQPQSWDPLGTQPQGHSGVSAMGYEPALLSTNPQPADPRHPEVNE